ncbi:MAG: hypothetical protein AVDCRST_MAG74-270 [uncultured Pyrinomonadaceae bacterium]|uniref:Lipoprotein n=1 Tax=uncultured Pyrinomonadaceae bacterium TaxID=2283094 RepID=A0A6J4N799_9BACT|nr:MAG: hypothetical protein AVDCRST_MAG74-270 [uncultured Pyrinomonadaceae bacterium]
MSKFFCLAILLIYAAGCSSSSNVAPSSNVAAVNVKNAETNSIVNQSVASAVNQTSANAEVPVNANKIVIQNSAISKDNVRNWDAKKEGVKENTPIAGKIEAATTAAPDNSEVLSRMNAKGEPVETRVFKKHRVLTKVERTDLNNQSIKVHLKNGKVVNLPEGTVENFLTASADDILKAVGEN